MSTTVYVPRLIETAEQAEALPEGTLAVRLDIPWIATKHGPDEDGHTWWESKNGIYDHRDVVHKTALVPVEAEEEGRSMYTDPDTGEVRHDFLPDRRADGSPVHTHTRLVAQWEETR